MEIVRLGHAAAVVKHDKTPIEGRPAYSAGSPLPDLSQAGVNLAAVARLPSIATMAPRNIEIASPMNVAPVIFAAC